MTGFEPATPWSQIKCTTKLCYIPINMARPVGLEPATFWSVVKRSIQLSYGRIFITLHQCLYILANPFSKCNNFFQVFCIFWGLLCTSQKKRLYVKPIKLVGLMGLEPIRGCPHRILSPMRLPIPPQPQNKKNGGSCRIWTGDHRVAVYCLTTWLRNHLGIFRAY